MLASQHLTPTEAAAHAKRKAFRQSIAAKAVPDGGRFSPERVAPAPVVVDEPELPTKSTLRTVPPKPAKIIADYFVGIEPLCYGPPRRPTIAEVQRIVAVHFGTTRSEINSARRTAKVVRPRMIAAYLAREVAGASLPIIGVAFGNRDHTTILHSVRKIEALLLIDKDLAETIEALRTKIVSRSAE